MKLALAGLGALGAALLAGRSVIDLGVPAKGKLKGKILEGRYRWVLNRSGSFCVTLQVEEWVNRTVIPDPGNPMFVKSSDGPPGWIGTPGSWCLATLAGMDDQNPRSSRVSGNWIPLDFGQGWAVNGVQAAIDAGLALEPNPRMGR